MEVHQNAATILENDLTRVSIADWVKSNSMSHFAIPPFMQLS
jgi:hypothetical protein